MYHFPVNSANQCHNSSDSFLKATSVSSSERTELTIVYVVHLVANTYTQKCRLMGRDYFSKAK